MVHARDASASRQQCAGVMRTEMPSEAKAMALDVVYWANAERCLLLASTGGIWICGYVLLGERGAGRCLLGHCAALPNAGFRQPVLALCRWRSGGAWSLPFTRLGWLGLFKGTGVCSSSHASQLATEPVQGVL